MDNSDRDVSLTVCLCVRLSDTTVSPAEMAEPIEIVWGMDYWGLKKPRWRPGSPTGRGTFRGGGHTLTRSPLSVGCGETGLGPGE